ncbi:MAG TPA: DNA repair protein RecO [Roseiflexaceae bacterium]|nr:DNA repair protein RecO [Roseiflexaceae bacterium]HMP39859.1 DNA repair protein RecO [Roseiflexaceae bacterium]
MRDRVYRTDAVIIRRSDFGEADRLLTIITPFGKRRVVAKGARKTSSRLAGHIELFTYTTLLLAVGRSLDIVTQSAVRRGHDILRLDLERISAAYYIAELVDRLTEEGAEDRQLFEVLIETLHALDRGSAVDLVLRWYELQVLDRIGYRPQLQECAVCEELLTEDAADFSPAAGGVVCSRCARSAAGVLAMRLPAFKLLRYLQVQPIGVLEQLTISSETRGEAERLMRAYVRTVLERDLKSVAFLEEVRTQP